MNPGASRGTFNTADIDKAQSSAAGLHRETETQDVVSGDDARTYESNGSESSEHSYTSSEFQDLLEMLYGIGVITDSDSDEEDEDVQDVSENDEVQSLSEFHLAAERGDTEAVRSLLITSSNVDVLDRKHNTPLHIATLNGHIDVVNLLLSKNASVNSRNAFGQTSLHLASKNCHLAIAQILLDSHADVHVTDQIMLTPIHNGAILGHHEFVQLLMRYCEVPLMWFGNTLLHFAANFGHTNVAQLFLDHNQNVDARNLGGRTPIHLASQNGHLEVAKVLLRNNADANTCNASSKTPLHIAAELGYEELVKALIDHGGVANAVDGDGNTALHYAANNGHNAVVNVLLNQTAGLDALIRSQLAVNQVPVDEFEVSHVDFNQTSNHFAAEGCNVEIPETDLRHSSPVKADIKGQVTPLQLAVGNGHAEIVTNSNSANVNACNNAKMTPLHLACQNGHTSIVEILLDNHATVDVMKQYEKTPFYLAAENGHAGVSDLLLRRGICDFVLTNGNETPLHVAVDGGHTKVVEVILKHSHRISGKLLKSGQKLQEKAKNLIETRDIKKIQLLKSDGRRISAGVVLAEKRKPLEIWEDSEGYAALQIAVHSTEPKMVKHLLNVDQCEYSEEQLRECFESLILFISSYKTKQHRDNNETRKVRSKEIYYENIKEIARALINSSKFNVNHQNVHGQALLHKAICMDLYPTGPSKELHRNYVIQLLLEKGADFNLTNDYGGTPLTMASQKGCFDVIQILFNWEHKSGMKLELDVRDHSGETALIKAAERNHVSAVRLLLNHKASVNLSDNWPNCGITALHAAIYEPNWNWYDLHFFCDGLCKGSFDSVYSLEISSRDKLTWREETVDPIPLIGRIQICLEKNKEISRIKEELVNLLLDNDEINVNAVDFRGNTSLDLAVKSCNQIASGTLKALRNRGAIRKLLKPEEKAPMEVARVDERGRNPLHRLTIFRISDYKVEDMTKAEREQVEERFDSLVYGILLKPENFRESATAADEMGRTPLHYAVMPPFYSTNKDPGLIGVLLEIGSNVNAADMYGKTPLHYAEMDDQYEFLVHYGANANVKDIFGNTPRDLKQLRESVTTNRENAEKLSIGKKALYPSRDIAQALNHVTELSKRKVVETIRIYSQSPRPQESSEEAIWKVWTQNEFFLLNRRLNQLNPLIQQFIERLADGIKEKDWRFECQPILVGSADEETKVVISADFDFNFKLIKFSQLCDAFPHPLGPTGYFQLRRKMNEDTKSQSYEKFSCFFNSEQCLLTNEVNYRFKIILEEVLSERTFWRGEHLFEWIVLDKYKCKSENLHGLCKTIDLRMIHPIEDGEGGSLFLDILIDVVACVHMEGGWSEVQLPVGTNSVVKTDGCTFVFDEPRFHRSKLLDVHSTFSKTFVRISFAPLESRIIKESSPLIRAAYIVSKMILYSHARTTYQLKTCLMFCMEALDARNGSETRNEDELTPKQLAFWIERLMFCFMEFHRIGIFPCYFMPTFRRRVLYLAQLYDGHQYLQWWKKDKLDISSETLIPFKYPTACDYYLDLCPDDTTIDIPTVAQIPHRYAPRNTLCEDDDPMWQRFNRENLVRTLSSRSFHS